MAVKLDSAGIAEILKRAETMDAVVDAAEAVKSAAERDPAVSRHGVPVKIQTGYSDRARAVVALAHPAGMPIQAKHGSLSRAVSAAGLSARRALRGWRRGGG